MAVTVSTIADPLGTKLVIGDANATAEDAAITGATTIYAVEIDNSDNTAATYVKIVDSVGPVGVGTDDPDIMIRATGGVKETYMIGTGDPFAAGISFWAVKSPYSLIADDADSAISPASAVIVKILCT